MNLRSERDIMTNTLDTADAIEVDVEGYALVNTPMLNETQSARPTSPARNRCRRR